MTDTLRTKRTEVHRLPLRGTYDRETVHAILDEGLICHVGFVFEGSPFVIPTGYGRDGDRLLIHGSAASRMLRALSAGAEACITVTLLDGLVLARSAFHHSMNYRSAVVLGTAREVTETTAKVAAMRALVDHLMTGRWEDARQPTAGEIAATIILELTLSEASAKVRTGGPIDSEADYLLPVWAGVVPLRLTPGTPVRDGRLPSATELPEYVRRWRSGS